MKAIVEISLKEGILDPQAKAIFNALQTLGFSCVRDLKIAKEMIVDLSVENPQDAEKVAESMAHDLLSNPVIENYKIEIVP